MIVFGLTGGIASGKSTVARLFRERGVPIVDADQLAREAVAPGSPALAAIREAFGEEVFGKGGALDRKRLGAEVFGKPDALARLNAIVHPRVAELALAAFASHASEGAALIGYEVPLLVENGLHHAFRPVVVIAVDKETQLARLMARDGLDREAAEARLASQLPLEARLAVADFVIENRAEPAALSAEVDRVLAGVRGFTR